MSILKAIFINACFFSLINCSITPPNALTHFTKPEFAQADSYFLYAYALRDAQSAPAGNAAISQRKKGKTIFYTFKDHIIKECGTHLNGVIKITTGLTNDVQADFPTVTQNPLGIKNFTFAMKEDPKNPKTATGIAVVNGTTFNIKDIIVVSGF